jgi:hypothetical protein
MGIVTDFLPENYQYRVKKSNYPPTPNAQDLEAEFLIKKVNNETQFIEWFEQFKSKTCSGWIVARSSFIKSESKQARFVFGININIKFNPFAYFII